MRKSKMKIPLVDAFKLLQTCHCIVYDSNLIYPSLNMLTGTDENEFLYIGWYDPNSEKDCFAKFTEEDNREVTVSGSSMYLIDLDNTEMEITLLAPMNIV